MVLHQLNPLGTLSLEVVASALMATTLPDELGLVLISGIRSVPAPLPAHNSSHDRLDGSGIAE